MAGKTDNQHGTTGTQGLMFFTMITTEMVRILSRWLLFCTFTSAWGSALKCQKLVSRTNPVNNIQSYSKIVFEAMFSK